LAGRPGAPVRGLAGRPRVRKRSMMPREPRTFVSRISGRSPALRDCRGGDGRL
jgi:hypothetical protein